ncbi:hypothetical protein SCARD494_01946 [Seiridium cardinale]
MRLRIVNIVFGLLLVPIALALPSASQTFFSRTSARWVVGQSVNTTSGSVIGHPASNNTEVSEYLGIPYAQPPVDNLRWQPPVAYTGTAPINGSAFVSKLLSRAVDARGIVALITSKGYACMQAHPSLQAEHSLGIYYNLTRAGYYITPDVLLPDTPQSEDCLTLNVWTQPQTGEGSKAVLVWIHGGSFTGGSSSEVWFNGQSIAGEQDIVLVSINYRLNIFGFPGNPLSELNLGIMDQRMALEWIRDNIAQFGGDPNRIVMFGQSAGAASIDIHSYAYADDPIASAYVLQSGTAWSFGLQPPPAASNLWYGAARAVRCNNGMTTPGAVFNCMMKVPPTELIKSLPPIPYGVTPGLPYGPVVDGKIVFQNYHDLTPAARPMVIGNTNDESGMTKLLTPWWSGMPSWYYQVQNTYVFTCPAGQRAAENFANGNPTWRYRWFGAFPNVLLPWTPYNGSWHGSELPSIFNTAPQYYYPNTHRENVIGQYMRGAWAAFAKDPINGLNNYDGWSNYDPDGETLIQIAYGNKHRDNGTLPEFTLGSSLFEPEGPRIPIVDVVFVHGFTGHPYRTWASKGNNSKIERDDAPEPKRRKLFGRKDEKTTSGKSYHQFTETYWPRDFVPAGVPDARVRVLTFGYDTKIRHVLGAQGSENSVYDHAKELLQSLDDYRIDPDSRKRPIIFIAHSLGGIVIKEAIRQSQRIGGSHRQRSLHQISESVIGIIFFGTPHRGADPRGFLQHIAQKVCETMGFRANKQIVDTLMPNSERLKELLDDFPPLAREKKWIVYSFQEQLGVKALNGKRVVEDVSSCIGDSEVEVTRGIESNHMDMCRFEDPDHPQYLKVASALRQILNGHKLGHELQDEMSASISSDYPDWKKTSSDSASPSDELPLVESSRQGFQLSEHRRTELVDSLAFDQIDARLANLRPPKANTCSWMLTTSQYKEWKQHQKLTDHHGFFWIRGKPGSGKSIMMKYLFSKAKSTVRSARVISFFFNARGAQLEHSTLGLYRSLLFQLLKTDTSLHHAFDILGYHASRATGGDWQVSTLKNVLANAIELLKGQALICYIDALDECPEDEIRDMISFFEDLGEHALECGVRLHICFSSRHYPHITIRTGLNLILEDERSHTMDIKMFIDSELRIGQSENVDDIKEKVVAKASGVFLWVALVTPILNTAYDRGKTRELMKKLNELPPRLSDLFRDILLRDSRNREALLLCLQWVLFAKAPMELEVLYFAIGEDAGDDDFFWNHEQLSKEDMSRHLLDTSKGLIEETKSKTPTVQFIHESFRDFLLKENGLKQLWPNLGDNYDAESHGSLAKRCLQQVNTNMARRLELPNPLPETPSEIENLRGDIRLAFPFMEYAIIGIIHHSNAAQALGISQLEFIQQFPLGAWMACHNAIVKHRSRRHPSDTSLLYILAEHDLASLVLIHPDRLQHHQIQGGRYRYPLLAALACGSRQVSRDLGWQVFLDQGILMMEDPDYEAYFSSLKPNRGFQTRKRTLLDGVLAFSCAPAFGALLSLGASISEVDGPRQSVLTRAKTPKMVEALILSGADPNQKNADGYPIVLGPHWRSRDVYKTLLQYGFERAASDAEGRTIFSYAAEYNHVGCFEDMPSELDAKLVNVPDSRGMTPFLHAARNGHTDVLKLLYRIEGVDPDLADNGGRTPLSYAVGHSIKATGLLLESGKVDSDSKDNKGGTPLSYAVVYSIEATRLLLKSGKVDPDSKDNEGRTPLSYAVEYSIETTRMLLESGKVDPGSTDNEGRTPLSYAAQALNSGTFTLLLNTGKVDIKSKDNEGRTALWYTMKKCRVDTAAYPTIGSDPEVTDTEGRTPLSHVCSGLRYPVDCKFLLESWKADPNSKDSNGRTPLSYAIEIGRANQAMVLLNSGKVEPDSQDKDGKTPLRWLVDRASDFYLAEYCIQLLLRTGQVDPLRKAKDGLSPLEAAKLNTNKDMRRLIVMMEHFMKTGETLDRESLNRMVYA